MTELPKYDGPHRTSVQESNFFLIMLESTSWLASNINAFLVLKILTLD